MADGRVMHGVSGRNKCGSGFCMYKNPFDGRV
jgi:hypothetical protein